MEKEPIRTLKRLAEMRFDEKYNKYPSNDDLGLNEEDPGEKYTVDEQETLQLMRTKLWPYARTAARLTHQPLKNGDFPFCTWLDFNTEITLQDARKIRPLIKRECDPTNEQAVTDFIVGPTRSKEYLLNPETNYVFEVDVRNGAKIARTKVSISTTALHIQALAANSFLGNNVYNSHPIEYITRNDLHDICERPAMHESNNGYTFITFDTGTVKIDVPVKRSTNTAMSTDFKTVHITPHDDSDQYDDDDDDDDDDEESD